MLRPWLARRIRWVCKYHLGGADGLEGAFWAILFSSHRRNRPDRLATRQWEHLRRRILDRDGWRCQRCGRPGRLEVHHVRPLFAGGTDDPANLETRCRTCHLSAHRRRRPRTAAQRQWDRLADAL